MPYDDRGRWNDPLFTEEEYLEIIAEQEAERPRSRVGAGNAGAGRRRSGSDAPSKRTLRSHGQSDSAHKRDRVG